jgi:hypothetical protein
LNTFVDRLSLLHTELRFEPFNRLAILFGIVAAAISVTKRNDIAWDRTWAIIAGEGYPMVCGKYMPKTRGTPAGGTKAVEVIKRELPVGICEVDGQGSNPRGTSLANSQTLLGIVTLPTQRAIQDYIAPPLVVQTVTELFCLGVAQGIGAAILLGSFTLLIHLDLALYGIAIAQIVFVRVLNIALGIASSPLSLLLVVTGFALRAKTVFSCAVTREIFSSCGVFSAAFGAFFEGVHRCNYTAKSTLKGLQVTVT